VAKVRETDLRPPYLASALPERQNWEVEILTKEATCLSLTPRSEAGRGIRIDTNLSTRLLHLDVRHNY